MDAKAIINDGLGKLGSYSINSIDDARTPLERRIATHYPQWLKSELTIRRWAFNNYAAVLVQSSLATQVTATHPYGFALPNDCLSVDRHREDQWVIRGKYIYNPYPTLTIEYRADVPVDQYHVLFNDVAALRVAIENCDWVTQSNVKIATLERWYKDKLKLAAANNALVLEPDYADEFGNADDEWLLARMGADL